MSTLVAVRRTLSITGRVLGLYRQHLQTEGVLLALVMLAVNALLAGGTQFILTENAFSLGALTVLVVIATVWGVLDSHGFASLHHHARWSVTVRQAMTRPRWAGYALITLTQSLVLALVVWLCSSTGSGGAVVVTGTAVFTMVAMTALVCQAEPVVDVATIVDACYTPTPRP